MHGRSFCNPPCSSFHMNLYKWKNNRLHKSFYIQHCNYPCSHQNSRYNYFFPLTMADIVVVDMRVDQKKSTDMYLCTVPNMNQHIDQCRYFDIDANIHSHTLYHINMNKNQYKQKNIP